MGVHRLQTFLQKYARKECCKEADVKELSDAYKRETGKDPVLVVDGNNCLRSASLCGRNSQDVLLGGQMQEFIKTMKDFVAAFENIGVKVVFFFDGMTPESHRVTRKERKERKVDKVVSIFENLNNNSAVEAEDLNGMLPSLVAATASFVAKYVCGCDVHISVSDCDVEIANFARKEDCFAILSQDTDFVILQGARHFLTAKELNLETMTTHTYSREGLLKFLGLKPQQLFLLASLLGNDIIPYSTLRNFHERLKQDRKGCGLLHVVDYIKKCNFGTCSDDEGLRKIAKDVFNDESKALELATSIQNYLSPSTEAQEGTTVADKIDDNWQQILNLAEKKHRSCQVQSYLYDVISRKVYEMSGNLEDYSKKDIPVAKIYKPLRQRIYGVLFHEKTTVTAVSEWCVENRKVPSQPTYVPVMRMPRVGRIHPGLLKLWDDKCEPDIRWRLFAESLTKEKKLDPKALQNLGLPYVVPVAVLFYLLNECENQISETDVEAILAQAALVKLYSPEELEAIRYPRIHPKTVHLCTVFTRGVTTVLLLLSACGFDIEKAMPWHYFDGKLFQQKYVQQTRTSVRLAQLCDDKADALSTFRRMKELVLPPTRWR